MGGGGAWDARGVRGMMKTRRRSGTGNRTGFESAIANTTLAVVHESRGANTSLRSWLGSEQRRGRPKRSHEAEAL